MGEYVEDFAINASQKAQLQEALEGMFMLACFRIYLGLKYGTVFQHGGPLQINVQQKGSSCIASINPRISPTR